MIDTIKKTLWAAADKMRANMDAAECKHIVLGLIFLKYISNTFTAWRRRAGITKPDFQALVRQEYRVASARVSCATERLWGGNIRRRTDSFSSFEYLDILHHPTPPASAIDVRNTVPTSLTRGGLKRQTTYQRDDSVAQPGTGG